MRRSRILLAGLLFLAPLDLWSGESELVIDKTSAASGTRPWIS